LNKLVLGAIIAVAFIAGTLTSGTIAYAKPPPGTEIGIIDVILEVLEDPVFGLEEIKTEVAAIEIDVGDIDDNVQDILDDLELKKTFWRTTSTDGIDKGQTGEIIFRFDNSCIGAIPTAQKGFIAEAITIKFTPVSGSDEVKVNKVIGLELVPISFPDIVFEIPNGDHQEILAVSGLVQVAGSTRIDVIGRTGSTLSESINVNVVGLGETLQGCTVTASIIDNTTTP